MEVSPVKDGIRPFHACLYPFPNPASSLPFSLLFLCTHFLLLLCSTLKVQVNDHFFLFFWNLTSFWNDWKKMLASAFVSMTFKTSFEQLNCTNLDIWAWTHTLMTLKDNSRDQNREMWNSFVNTFWNKNIGTDLKSISIIMFKLMKLFFPFFSVLRNFHDFYCWTKSIFFF